MASIRRRSAWRVIVAGKPELASVHSTQKQAQATAARLAAAGHADVRCSRAPGGSWEVRIRRQGAPALVKTFPRKDLAEEWAAAREGEIVKREFVDYREAERNTLGDLLRRYRTERLAGRDRHDADCVRIARLCEHPLAAIRMSLLKPADVAGYRDERRQVVKGATVKKELELIARVISVARAEWGVQLVQNPASGRLVRRPDPEPGDERDRRLAERHVVMIDGVPEPGQGRAASRRKQAGELYVHDPEAAALLEMPQTEQQALLRACRYPHWYVQRKANVTEATREARERRSAEAPVKARMRGGLRLWAVVSFAIETAMRRGEMVKLRWSHVRLDEGYLELPGAITKNRRPRMVPLTLRARRILATQPRAGELVFDTNVNTVKLAFRRALKRAQCQDLRMHDLRHEGTSRLFERTDLREAEIGWVTGHTDRRMLNRYYNKRPAEFVERFRQSFKK
ncbi:site-specific integrase [Caldimonas tepidiphila]|uniref:site-specific integrase n=1 Tax=Caldimonas tepidiphila TaxID=2315841 RepID=UPI000E5AD29D|nr:site-specific integrase [Caldimonas tepidiphila]